VLFTGSGINTVVYVGYGGYDFPAKRAFSHHNEKKEVVRVPSVYAKRQHEDMGLKHPRGGQAKYLSEPCQTRIQEISDAIRQEVRKP
jgi:hypothetical protein